MGLLKILRKLKRRELEMRLLVLGLDNAGKTTIVTAINGGDIHTIAPTLGFSITTLYYLKYKLNIWDVGGQQTLRSYWKNYYEATDGLVWVVDSADARRLSDARKELHQLLVQEKLSGASLLILANKQDLPGALSQQQLAEALDLHSIQLRHWSIVTCSGVTKQGLEEGISWLVNDIAKRIYFVD